MRTALAIGCLVVLLAPASAQTWDGRIVIDGDGQLDAEHGVTSGTGTPDDPFVIGPWHFESAPSQPAIWIRDTTASLRIEGIVIDALEASHGILVENAQDITIRDVTANERGFVAPLRGATVQVATSTGVDVSDVRSSNPRAAVVWVQDSFDVRVHDMHVQDSGIYGIWIDGVHGGIIEDSTIAGADDFALYLCDSSDLIVQGNRIEGAGRAGVDLTNAHRNIFRDNDFIGPGSAALKIIMSDDTYIEDNTFRGWDTAVDILSGAATTLDDNTFEDNEQDIVGEHDRIEASTPGPGAALLAIVVLAAARRQIPPS